MSVVKKGRRHPLLLYRSTMDRFWKITLPFAIIMGLILFAAGRFVPGVGLIPALGNVQSAVLFFSVVILTAFTVIFIILRNIAYVQPMKDHFRLVTPFLRVNISYRRIRSFHPVDVAQVYPPDKLKYGERRALESFYGTTALTLELRGYPLSPGLMRLFLGKLMFLPQSTGLVLIVPEWMSLSTELDSLRSVWLQSQTRRAAEPANYTLLKSLRKK